MAQQKQADPPAISGNMKKIFQHEEAHKPEPPNVQQQVTVYADHTAMQLFLCFRLEDGHEYQVGIPRSAALNLVAAIKNEFPV